MVKSVLALCSRQCEHVLFLSTWRRLVRRTMLINVHEWRSWMICFSSTIAGKYGRRRFTPTSRARPKGPLRTGCAIGFTAFLRRSICSSGWSIRKYKISGSVGLWFCLYYCLKTIRRTRRHAKQGVLLCCYNFSSIFYTGLSDFLQIWRFWTQLLRRWPEKCHSSFVMWPIGKSGGLEWYVFQAPSPANTAAGDSPRPRGLSTRPSPDGVFLCCTWR